MQNLVIVESPTKARTLAKFLGSKYQIEASMGHIRDLPKSELGIDTKDHFEPRYIIPRDKKKKVGELKKLAKAAKTIYLASDPDREGEAIAWHIANIVSDGKKDSTQDIKRVVFHEITEDAIKDAFEHPRELDMQLINAQQARRVLDRLVGYKLSPLLWKKVKRGLSAGRVQTVTLRLIVDREREVEKFIPLEYWSIEADLEAIGGVIVGQEVGGPSSARDAKRHSGNPAEPEHPESNQRKDSGQARMTENRRFLANLIEIGGKKLDFKSEDPSKRFFIQDKETADKHLENLKTARYSIEKVTKKEVKRMPSPPFTTSTLQQTAGNRLGFTAKRTMMLAQNLYEHGLITYMRTDSFNLSPIALTAARELIESKYGKPYLPPQARVFRSKSKNAQEAHEAIRPTNVSTSPDHINFDGISRDHKRLYDLIWKRMLASQMSEAVLDQTSIDVRAVAKPSVIVGQEAGGVIAKQEAGGVILGTNLVRTPESDPGQARMTDTSYLLRASGSVLKFDGWLTLYGVSQIEEESEDPDEKKQVLPEVKEGERLDLKELLPKQHFTEPPPRYTEASLIKKLEELGIGRPSTYAPILSTIQERFYVERQERKFVPTPLGTSVADFLVKYFSDVFDYAFTARMEDELDEISRGEREWKTTIGEFYNPFEKKLEGVEETAEHVKLEVETVDKACPLCGKGLVVRVGKFGKFLACSGFPECKHTESQEQAIDAKCPEDGGDVVVRKTKKGKVFYGCKNWPTCKYASWTKPK